MGEAARHGAGTVRCRRGNYAYCCITITLFPSEKLPI